MRETQNIPSSEDRSAAASSVTVLCPLLPAHSAAQNFARLLELAHVWSERGYVLELVVVDDAKPRAEQPVAKSLGPIRLVRRSSNEDWGRSLGRIVASARGQWVLVAAPLALEQPQYIEEVLQMIHLTRRPTIGAALLGSSATEPSDEASAPRRHIAAFAATKELVLQATKQLSAMRSEALIRVWWEAIEKNVQDEALDQPVLVTLPPRHPLPETTGSVRLATAGPDRARGSAPPAVFRAAHDVRILLAIAVSTTITSLLLSGRLAHAIRWVGGCSGFSAASLWTVQKLVLPTLDTVLAAARFSAHTLAPSLRIAAWLHLSCAAILAPLAFVTAADLWELGTESLALACATALLVTGVHLLTWSRVLEAVGKPARDAEQR